MKRAIGYPALVVYGSTALVWARSLFRFWNRLNSTDFWLLVLLFAVPAGLVLCSLWVMFERAWWRRVLGVLMLAPALAIWVVTLMFANAGFRIH